MAELGYMLLGNPEISEQMMRALDLKGDLPQHLVPTISPTVQAEDFNRAEFQYLRRMSRWQGGVSVAAVAAQHSYAMLGRNSTPDTRRSSIAVVERIVIANNNGTTNPNGYWVYLLANGAAPGPGGNSGLPMDDRNFANGALSVAGQFTIGGTNSATDFHPAGIVGGAMRVEVPANNTVQLEGPWILTGNADSAFVNPVQLMVQMNSQNMNLSVTFVWRERNMFSSER